MKAILASTHKVELADTLLSRRHTDHLADRIDQMLTKMTGVRNPAKHVYNQRAAQQLEHLDTPLDPSTQMPPWRDLLAATKGTTVSRQAFMKSASLIFNQHDLYTVKENTA